MKAGVSKLVLGVTAALTLSVGVSASDLSEDAIKKRIAPIGNVYLAGAEPAKPEVPAGPRSGKDVYQTTCFGCHGTGAAGAPKKGDADAWAPRLAQGEAKLFAHAWDGFNAMPPKGTCMNCSKEELQAAIDFMVEGL
ncbi:cytochrome c5 family protein [Psychrobium sp. 1_MG-2023]|uniref:c-type cytochrome n=1 Tax=Psychrobium sp. 1_MG-2023 TaxID=3062624 RepID=UPI000C333A40|nr:cytochrome c5 family protein [Psychrobium sp. 1_MG-2023]MDP2560988.1 cytochrome c5 family protein [Psychrobium sp. 1_MG-2023]PKF58282.1 hypothetical protein CW748_03730 [Alteromonadales bacterium alter-6D02]